MDNVLEGNSLVKTLINKSDIVEMNEIDLKVYDVSTGNFILLSIFYGTISILAVLGNMLVIFIVRSSRQMHTVTNFFIANLALADVTIGLFVIPFQFQAAVLQRWVLPDFMCPFCPFVQYISVNVSVFTLTAIAIDRHKAILNPLRARSSKFTSKIIIGIIWIVSITMAFPIGYGLRVVDMEHVIISDDNRTTNISKPFCQNIHLTDLQMRYYRYILVLVQYLIPFFIISFVYIQMAIKLWGSKTPGNAQDVRDLNLLKNKKKVIKMLVIVVILFGVCWLPLQTYNILQVTFPDINESKFINIIWLCCDWLAMSNSCYNPFIYGIYNEKFKREFYKRFSFFHKFGFGKRFFPANGGNHGVTGATTMTDYHTDKTVSLYTRAGSFHSSSNVLRNSCCQHPKNDFHGNLNINYNGIIKNDYTTDEEDYRIIANPFIDSQVLNSDMDGSEKDFEFNKII